MNHGYENNSEKISKKQMLTEGPSLAHYAKDKENIATTEASATALGRHKTTGIQTDSIRKQIPKRNRKDVFYRCNRITSSFMGIAEISILSLRKESTSINGSSSMEPLFKRSRCNKQYSARLTRW